MSFETLNTFSAMIEGGQSFQNCLIGHLHIARTFHFLCTPSTCISQCSTVVHNTVVRVTIKVSEKPQILGTRSPQTPESIDLKFDFDDYIGGLTLRTRNGTNRPSRGGGAKG